MKRCKHFLLGFLLGALIFGSISVFADSVTIQAFFNNIKVSVDGKAIELKDSKGNKVEPFIHEGTTYLPVKAIAESLGMEVKYNETTNTVELTKKKGGTMELKKYDPSKGENFFDEEHSGMNGIMWDVFFYITPEELQNKYPDMEVKLEGNAFTVLNVKTNESVEKDINLVRTLGFPNGFKYEGELYISYDCISKIMPKKEAEESKEAEENSKPKPSIKYYKEGNLEITYFIREDKKYVTPIDIIKSMYWDYKYKIDMPAIINEEGNAVTFNKDKMPIIENYPVIHKSGNLYVIPYDDYKNDLLPKLLEVLKTE